jgi:hypothetical protein
MGSSLASLDRAGDWARGLLGDAFLIEEILAKRAVQQKDQVHEQNRICTNS